MSAKLPPYTYYFAIISRNDRLLYETQFSNIKEMPEENISFLKQFVTHAALDITDQQQWRTQNMFLRCVDKFNQWFVSAFLTPSLTRFVIVHDMKNEQGIRNFFNDVLELYIKYTMNPFYEDGGKIQSEGFEKKVQICGKKYLCS